MTDSKRSKARRVSSHQRELLRERAWRKRHEPTATERQLWQALRGRQLGVSFRRQVVLQGYIADFYASKAKLIVEDAMGWHPTGHAISRAAVAVG